MRGTRTMEAIKDDGLVKAAANLNKKIKRM